jgi:hypothetical protein
VNRFVKSAKSAFSQYAALKNWGYAVGIPLTVSYIAAEVSPTSREIAPLYFDHVGNAAVGFSVAVSGAYTAARWLKLNRPHETQKTLAGRAVGAGLMSGALFSLFVETPLIANALAKTTLAEITDFVADPKDLVVGLAGTALGAYALSMRRVEAQQSRELAERVDMNFVYSGQMAAVMARAR